MAEPPFAEPPFAEPPFAEPPFAGTPEPPYVAVIFTSTRTEGDHGYGAMAASMESLAAKQPGYLGIEAARDADLGITVSYWADDAAAQGWKQVAAHLIAQQRGRAAWYRDYRVRVATVHRDYGLQSSSLGETSAAS
jgi:heme-degrading monooxygenase HmoA